MDDARERRAPSGPGRRLSSDSPCLQDANGVASAHGLGELLYGLDSDDLNDFEGLDDSAMGNSRLASFESSGLAAQAPISNPVAGFATGAGRVLAPPSRNALDRARRLFEDDGIGIVPTLGSLPTSGQTDSPESPNKRRRTQGPEDLSTTSFFTTGRGGTVPPPSRDAIDRATRILDDGGKDLVESTSTANSTFSTPGGHLSSAGIDVVDPIMSSAARARALAVLGESLHRPPTEAGRLMSDVSRKSSSLFTTAAGSPAKIVSVGSRARAMALLGETELQSPIAAVGDEGDPSSQASQRLSRNTVQHRQLSTPSRPPLQQTTNIFVNRALPQLAKTTTPTSLKTPSNPQLGSTGRSTSTHLRRTGQKPFTTPFKAPGSVRSASKLAEEPLSTPRSLRIPLEAASNVHKTVFDLHPPPHRRTWREAFLKPQYYSTVELQEIGLPDEIWRMNLSNAIHYQFIADDGSLLSNLNAFEQLQRDGANLATAKWVDNHYSLILWKIAGMIQAQPDLFDDVWHWKTVILQLKYRYEREFGFAQRPIVRRIQEHDSSPAVPMVLCISRILRPAPRDDGSGKLSPIRPALELTDGWYRINAEVDECLARAICGGRLAVGRKLAVSGAKLDSAAEGEDALEAMGKSRLIISANSSSLARWDARLGAQKLPFIAQLSHLSHDGGIITLLDVVIEKMFPLAFVPSGKDGSSPPWGEEEECARQDQWREKYESELSRLREGMKVRLERIEDLVGLLASLVEDLPQISTGSVLDDPDIAFDRILAAQNPMPIIKQLPAGQLIQVATHARSRLEQAVLEAQNEIKVELESTCPERLVRSFRLVRVRDTLASDKPFKRLGMLTLWEAKNFPEGSIQQGRRYLLSNIVPGRTGDWSLSKSRTDTAEIYLHTRRDTRWQPVI